MIAGIDLSTRFVDVVKLDEDTDAATWHRFPLTGNDAFDRARSVGLAVPGRAMSFWDDVVAVGIEDPRGYGAGFIYRVQGAVLACIPAQRLVHPWLPSQWRKAVGMPGNASKVDVHYFVTGATDHDALIQEWPQDACDAYCIALATRQALHGAVAA